MAGSEQDGVDGADADLFEGAVWVLTPDRAPPTTRAFARLRAVIADARRRRGGAGARPPRRAGGGRVARPAPHRRVADAAGRRPGRRAPRPAAPGGRRLPRHDPDRGGPPGHLARHLRREPRRHRRRARRPARVARRGARRSWPTTTATGCSPCSSRPARPGPTCRRGSPAPATWARSASRCPTAPGVLAEVTTLAGTLDVNIADLEIAHSSEGERGVLILLVEAGAAERLRAGLVDQGYRPVGHPAGVAVALPDPLPIDAARRARSTPSCRLPGLEEHHQPGPGVRGAGRGHEHAHRRARTPTTPRRWSTASAALGRRDRRRLGRRPARRSRARRAGPIADVALVDARLSGTTSRFLLPVAGAGGGASPRRRAPTGCGSDRWAEVVDAVRALGADGARRRRAGPPPGRGRSAARSAGGEVAVRGDVSSQFLSGLLLAGPAMPHRAGRPARRRPRVAALRRR